MPAKLLLCLLGAPSAVSLHLDVCTRRAVLCGLPLASLSLPAIAAQRGAEDPYAMVMYDQNPCTKRNPLGACQEQTRGATAKAAEQPLKVLQIEPEPESDLIRALKQRTADNAEKNAREVYEKTLKANLPGTFAPWASEAPVMTANGDFELLPIARFEALKDKGKIVKSATGLDVYAPGFDPKAPPPPKSEGGRGFWPF